MSEKRKVALAFMAHPDDAEFLCTGTMMRLGDLGWELHIATATRGDCGTMTHSADEISAIRSKEAQDAASVIGATWHTLDEKDGKVCYDKPTLEKAYSLFRKIAPSLVFTHALADYMMDHEMVALIARSASFLYGAPNISGEPLIPGSGVPYLYYCDPIDGTDPLGNPVNPPILIDVTEQMPRKIEMLSRHVSQREWLRAHHGMDEYIEAMKRIAAHRGNQLDTTYAEAFTQHRGHAYPQDNLLTTL